MKKQISILLAAVFVLFLTAFSALAAAPAVTLTSPNDGVTDTDGSVTFKYTVNDDLGNVSNCVLLINNTVDQTDTTIASTANAATENTFDKTGMSSGTYSWYVRCTDGESFTVNSSSRILKIFRSHFEIKDIKAYIDDSKQSGVDEDCATSSSNCDIDRDVYPESEIKLVFEFKNTWDKDDNNRENIEDITVTAKLDDDDFGDEVDVDDTISKIKPEATETAEITFTIPYDAKEGTYDLEITIEASDGSIDLDDIDFTFDLEVDRKAHEVKIKTSSLGSDTLKCTRSTTLDLKVINTGSNDEDEVAVLASNKDLGLNYKITGLELFSDPDDGDNEWTKTLEISAPDTLKPGNYPISIKVYYSGDDKDGVLADDKKVSVNVENCTDAQPASSQTANNQVEVITTTTQPGQAAANNSLPAGFTDVPTTVEKKSFFDSSAFLIVLVVAIIAVIGIGLLMILKLLA